MSKAFYRKYRSKKLSEVVGQNHITTVLERAIEQGKISHAYLFTGPRGVGKTSIARILAHEINNLPYNEEENHPDIIEIDAASNNSVEDIRDLRERIQMAPISAKFRVYVIDEVHMLSKSAFNALLKTLEEPPAHAVFILATTDAHKLPATIISRTQQFNFHLIKSEEIIAHLRHIATEEKIQIADDALELIAEKGGGSFRDSISLLDQISSLGKGDNQITAQTLEATLGLAPSQIFDDFIAAFETQNIAQILTLVENLRISGTSLEDFFEQFVNKIKKLLPQKPHLIRLILPLIEAKKSPAPDVELLTILIAEPTDFVVAPAIVSSEGSAKFDDTLLKAEISQVKNEISSLKSNFETLSLQNSKGIENISKGHSNQIESALKPISKGIEAKTETVETAPAPKPKAEAPKEEKVTEKPAPAPLKEVETTSSQETQPVKPKAETSTKTEASEETSGEFNWTAFIRKVKETSAGAGAILSRSDHKIEGNLVKIYTGAKIKKSQLEKATNRTIMSEAMAEIGASGWQIEVFAESKPFDDPTLANVAAIMGGGTEVKLNE